MSAFRLVMISSQFIVQDHDLIRGSVYPVTVSVARISTETYLLAGGLSERLAHLVVCVSGRKPPVLLGVVMFQPYKLKAFPVRDLSQGLLEHRLVSGPPERVLKTPENSQIEFVPGLLGNEFLQLIDRSNEVVGAAACAVRKIEMDAKLARGAEPVLQPLSPF